MDDYAPLIERLFAEEPREQTLFIEEIDGEVPDFIRGTYYLNGPARFRRGGFKYRHWLDGDGMVCAMRFGNGRPHFTTRWVRSAKFNLEEEAGRPVFRTFGTGFAGNRLKRGLMLESPVNVSVYSYAGTLLAFGEQGLPWELDPVTLATRGEFNFGGCLNEVSPFAAHPKFDVVVGEMFNFGVAFSATEPLLHVYRFDARARLIYRRRLRLPYACSLHDFGLSQRYAVFYLSPYILEMRTLARTGGTLMDALRWEPERGSHLLIVERDTGQQAAMIHVGQRYCLHFINCFEQDGRLNIDVLELEQPIYNQYQTLPDLFADVGEGCPVRFVVDVKNSEVIETAEIDYRLAPDFASIDPRQAAAPYHDFWMLGVSAAGSRGRKFFDQLVHANWNGCEARDVYQSPTRCYLGGEPVFVPSLRDEEGGAVICQVFDAERGASAFAVFSAFDVARGPIALLRLPEPMHPGFHASFVQASNMLPVQGGVPEGGNCA
jgi:all-trans-8'-apo-beta-carotenal 15,15'-oxygenase